MPFLGLMFLVQQVPQFDPGTVTPPQSIFSQPAPPLFHANEVIGESVAKANSNEVIFNMLSP